MVPCKATMQFWKTTLTYDGTAFNGWQVQPGLPTVQGCLSDALHRLTGERVLPQGSGRTDAGVHALEQVASFALASPIPSQNLLLALNRLLPRSIRVLSIDGASPDFHARHSARRKTYEYRIFPTKPLTHSDAKPQAPSAKDRICPPFLAPYVWDCRLPLCFSPLQEAADHILGTHDFTSFAAVDPERTQSASRFSNERTVFESLWFQVEDLLSYRITGSGFLHHMVRNLVGSFVECGSGRLPPDQIAAILKQRSRSAAGPTAPARGLFLVSVEYC